MGGILHNHTRIKRDFQFEYFGIFVIAEAYDDCYENQRKFPTTFVDWFETKYFGFITSRLYAGKLTLDKLVQDLTDHFER